MRVDAGTQPPRFQGTRPPGQAPAALRLRDLNQTMAAALAITSVITTTAITPVTPAAY